MCEGCIEPSSVVLLASRLVPLVPPQIVIHSPLTYFELSLPDSLRIPVNSSSSILKILSRWSPAKLPAMPATHSEASDHPWRRPTNNSTHAAIIVGVLIGVLGLVAMSLFLWDRRRRWGVKEGFRVKPQSTMIRSGSPLWQGKLSQLEVGVVREPLPVYQKEPSEGERRI